MRSPRRTWGTVAVMALLVACAPDGGASDRDGPGGAPAATDERHQDVQPEPDRGSEDAAPDAAAADAPPPIPPAYELHDDEIAPEAKQVAVDLVAALTTYERDEDLPTVAARAAGGDEDLAAHLATAAARLHHDGAWSRGEVGYPQLGGLEPTSASVMVAVDVQVGLPSGEVDERRLVLDVRVRRDRADSWQVDELASDGGRPVERPGDVSAAAAAVLDHPDLHLPDTARWDVQRGIVDDELLAVMARLADHTPYGVLVFDTGHPWNVFGTDRPSKHSEGRAVDIYRVDGRPVIEQRDDGSDVLRAVEWLYEQPEIAEIGSPWALDDRGGRSFTDDLHQDHLHVAVYRPAQPRP